MNPLQRQNAERFVEYLKWNGRKIYLRPEVYADLREHSRLYYCDVQQVISCLHRIGCIDIQTGGAWAVVQLLSDDVDRWAGIRKGAQ